MSSSVTRLAEHAALIANHRAGRAGVPEPRSHAADVSEVARP
jgi:hypothetical protein